MNLFTLNVLLSFLLAGSLIALLTLLAERLGSKTGGLIANLPSNILITMIFITLTHGVGFIRQMIPAIPIGMLVDTFFLLAFIILLKYGLAAAIGGSLFCWFILTLSAAVLQVKVLWINLAVYFVLTGLVFVWARYRLRIPPAGRVSKRYTGPQILMRAAFAGGIVGGVVLVSHYVPAYLTGIVSTFPAVLLSTMVILSVVQGREFARAIGFIMILSSTNIVIYAVSVYLTFPVLGIEAGTAVSFAAAFLWVLILKWIPSGR